MVGSNPRAGMITRGRTGRVPHVDGIRAAAAEVIGNPTTGRTVG